MLELPNGLARGVRTASDFLMALQLTGAAKTDSVTNMQLRLPVVVIGGGLTAIDTATESLAYYVVQVRKFLARYEQLAADIRTVTIPVLGVLGNHDYESGKQGEVASILSDAGVKMLDGDAVEIDGVAVERCAARGDVDDGQILGRDAGLLRLHGAGTR